MALQCYAAVKRTTDNGFRRPSPIPPIVIAGFCGDRSGSMHSMNGAPASGLYDWVVSQSITAVNNGQTGRIFVTTFDGKIYKNMKGVHADKVEISAKDCREWMDPNGCTKLYDTAVQMIGDLRKAASLQDFAPEVRALNPRVVVLFALLTDGLDNTSHACNAKTLNAEIRLARKDGWICDFLAANQDAVATGAQYGFEQDHSLTFGAGFQGASSAMESLRVNSSRAASSGHGYGYTALQRACSAPADNHQHQPTQRPLPGSGYGGATKGQGPPSLRQSYLRC